MAAGGIRGSGAAAKRALDVVGSLVLLPVLAPVFVACAALVLAFDGWPVLFLHERVGLGGRPFRLIKLRTMRAASGPAVTAAGDRRVTPLGRILRRLKLDELPQLVNVLAGRMSLVGSRPEVPQFVTAQARAYRAVLRLRPGMTGWASLVFRDEEALLAVHAGEPAFYATVLVPRKLALARLYARRRSLGLDLTLILATACAVVGADGAMRALVGPRLVDRAWRGLDA